uniref:Deoxynucleoside kinase n=2 Tax=Schistocephalus solidus TaxID=70667 RepID=A0A0X3NT59_SCHSO
MISNNLYKVAVEGNIGCGKSTFLKYFESLSPNIEVSLEPIERWNNVKGHKLFEMFYADPSTWSSPLQSQVVVTFLHQQATPQLAPVRLIERSLHSGRHCFIEAIRQNNQISHSDVEVLHEFYKFGRDLPFCKLDLIVYLRSSPEVCAERIRRRHRRGEEGISMDYLQQLHDLHDKWLLGGKSDDCPAPVLVFDCDEPLETITNVYYERREQVMCGVKS